MPYFTKRKQMTQDSIERQFVLFQYEKKNYPKWAFSPAWKIDITPSMLANYLIFRAYVESNFTC